MRPEWEDVPVGSVVTIHNVKMGARVKRGPDWSWGDQDEDSHGKRTEGTIIATEKSLDEDWASVEWDNGHINGYRIKIKHDLVFAGGTRPKKKAKIKWIDD